jgi:hypothetical protein
MRNLLYVWLPFALFALGCSSLRDKEIQRVLDSPIAYQSHLSPWADMAQYKTWTWVPVPANIPMDPRAKDPTLRGEIERNIENHMKVRGYEGPSAAPDLFVSYHVSTKDIDQEYIKRMYDGTYLPQYRMEFEGPASAERQWKEGTVLIFLFDAKSERMVWQSAATAEITDEAPQAKSIARLDEAIKTMFTSFPGRPSWESHH